MREKDPDKVEDIYKAALKIVMREGLSALKMSVVAREAKLATGTLYIYFDSKETLINQLYEELRKKRAKRIAEGYDPALPFMVNFEKIWTNYLNIQLRQPEATIFIEQYYRSPYMKGNVKTESNVLLQPIFDLLEKGKKERLVKDMPVALLAIQLSGTINELAKWTDNKQVKPDKQLIGQAFRLAWDSIKQ